MKVAGGTYNSIDAKKISLERVVSIMDHLGTREIYVKALAPNDNSKNQPYFGAHLPEISFIPTGDLIASDTVSAKTKDPSRRIKYHAPITLSWVDCYGKTYPAPHAKLIYYPQYPEVRFSGFLQGSGADAGEWMNPEKKGRSKGRWLILGVCSNGTVYAYLATPDSNLSRELGETKLTNVSSIFGQIQDKRLVPAKSTKDALIAKLLEVHHMGWVSSRKLNSDLTSSPYRAQNGAGYTLEALLGIVPNGFSEPDYLGWEVKQFGVKKFPRSGSRPTTLMTPEPDGGIYVEQGAANFVKTYGYADKSGKSDRLNFGGRHIVGTQQALTNLTLNLLGFDPVNNVMTDAKGVIALMDSQENIAASWSFAKLMDHWKRKHAQAVYIPCVRQKNDSSHEIEYQFGSEIELGTGTSFELILAEMQTGNVYYDPGIKLEQASTSNPKLKRRSQFRVAHKNLEALYKKFEFLDITGLS